LISSALREHRGGIGLEQISATTRRMAGLFLDLPMERAMREIIDQQLLSFPAEKEALEHRAAFGFGAPRNTPLGTMISGEPSSH